jgi:hypothetical protein
MDRTEEGMNIARLTWHGLALRAATFALVAHFASICRADEEIAYDHAVVAADH